MCEQRAERVVGVGVLRVEGERLLERRPRARRLPEFHVERAEVVERDRARVHPGHALECRQRGHIEALLRQLEAVLEVAAVPRR